MASDDRRHPSWSDFIAPSNTLSDDSDDSDSSGTSDNSDNSDTPIFYSTGFAYNPRRASDDVPREQFGATDEHPPRIAPLPPRPPPVTERKRRSVHLGGCMDVEFSDDELEQMEQAREQDDPPQRDVPQGATDFEMRQGMRQFIVYPVHDPAIYQSPHILEPPSRTTMDETCIAPMRRTTGLFQALPQPFQNAEPLQAPQPSHNPPPFQTTQLYGDPIWNTQPASQTMTMINRKGQTISITNQGGHTISIVTQGGMHPDAPSTRPPLQTRVYYNGIQMYTSMPQPQQPQQPQQPPRPSRSPSPEVVVGVTSGAARGAGSEVPPDVNEMDELPQANKDARRRDHIGWDPEHLRRRMELVRQRGEERRRAMRVKRERKGRGRETL